MKRAIKRRAGLLLTLAVLASTASGVAGCISLTSWVHNKRHMKQVWHEFEGLHEDLDRIVFGLERNPAE